MHPHIGLGSTNQPSHKGVEADLQSENKELINSHKIATPEVKINARLAVNMAKGLDAGVPGDGGQ